jgi:hypothetical protein
MQQLNTLFLTMCWQNRPAALSRLSNKLSYTHRFSVYGVRSKEDSRSPGEVRLKSGDRQGHAGKQQRRSRMQ